MTLFSETVLLRTKGAVVERDRYGREKTAGVDVDVTHPAWFEPRGSSENVAAKEQYIEGYWLYLPVDAPMGWDEVILGPDPGGEPYQMVGKPGYQPAGFVVEGFYRIALERVTG